jgi:hypothetical protein
MKRYATLAALLALAAAPGFELRAADLSGPRISSPVLGYAFDDSTQAIRTISGVPGAAAWGPIIDVPDTLLNAWVHSQARLAVGLGKAGSVVAVSWKQGVHSATLATSLGTLQQAAFSRSGAYVALSDGSAIEVWTKLDTEPTLAWRTSAAAISIAVDNNGAVAAGITDGTLVRIAGGESKIVTSGGDWRAVAFSGSQMIAADAAHSQLVSLDDNGGLTALGTLSSAASALAASADGLQIAALEDGSVEVFTAGVSAIAAVDNVKGFDLLDGNLAVYVRGSARVLDTDTGELRLTQLQNLAVTAQGGSAQ